MDKNEDLPIAAEPVSHAEPYSIFSNPEYDRSRIFTLGIIVALGLIGILYFLDWWTFGRYVKSTEDAYVGGNVTAIAPHVSGFIAAIPVGDNQYVHAGQVLLKLETDDLETTESRAEAAVSESVATLAELRARRGAQQAMIAEAQAEMAAKQATAAFAAADKDRYLTLATGVGGSRQDAQKALAAAEASKADVSAAEAQLSAARQQLSVLDTEITAAQARIQQADADLRLARIRLGYATVFAPVDGYVADRVAQVGAYAAEGTTLMSIVPAHGLWVDANFEEDKIAAMRTGNRAVVVADVLPGRIFHGHVASLAPATGAVFSIIPPENATGNFTKLVQRVPVRIILDGDESELGLLRPGLSVTASVDTR
jgi:membrane fusion protein (multidrug efflux system)